MSWRRVLGIALQLVCYALIGIGIAYFSASPVYTHLDPGLGMVKVSFSHTGARREECPDFTPEKIAKRPPSERFSMDCPRERLPVLLELDLDGALLHREVMVPAGIARDGVSSIYRKFAVAAGRHVLVARLRDSKREDGFDFQQQVAFELEPERNFVVDFRPETGGFVFKP